MAYNEKLAYRIRQVLTGQKNLKEKKMMGGLTFMVNDKMCIGIIKDEMMCRIDPERQDAALEKPGCRIMDFTGQANERLYHGKPKRNEVTERI